MTITDKQVEAAPVAFAIMTPAGISVMGWMDYARLYESALRTVALTEGCSYVFAYAALEAAEAARECVAPSYDSAMGEAAQRYIKSVGGSDAVLPQTFRWQGLWDAMIRAAPSSAEQPPPGTPLREWLGRRLAIENAAEASGESMDCTISTPSAMPSCLCCGRGGVAKCWAADHPEIYVCEQCHVKATATPPADAREGEDARICDGVHPHVRARTLLTALWQRYDSGGESLGRSHYAVLLEAAMALLEEFRDRDDVARLNAKYADVVGATRDYLSKRMADREGLPADRAMGGE